METIFKKYIQKEQLFTPKDKVLLAVSGGIDSMVMCHLFKEAGFKFGIAHCNFQLREADSDGDAAFVEEMAEKWEIPFHVTTFDTKKESQQQKKSIELMARELRYKWFFEILQADDYQYIATAHHLNDSLETVLYNLTKGTGIRGLHGIPVKNGQIIRPLSFANRDDIEAYAKLKQINYREDASNESTKHRRNLIRKKVIPPLKKINPSLERTFAKTLTHLKEVESLYHWAIQQQMKTLVIEDNELLKIDLIALKKQPAKSTILFEIIRGFGFNSDHVDQVFNAIDTIGAQFYSATHLLLVERKNILIKKKDRPLSVFKELNQLPKEIRLSNQIIYFEVLPTIPKTLNQGKNIAIIDLKQIQYPLTIRNWKDGDRFQPLGMQGKSKKIKDYLRDEKVSRFAKEKVLVLESAGQIMWVIDYRQDERFKVTEATEATLRLIHVENIGN